MKKIFPLLLMLVFLSSCNVHKTDNQLTYRVIDAYEAASLMIKEKDYIILDVRTQAEFESGHIPGAICIPNESISDQSISQLPDKDQLILVYCRSGNRSKQASEKLVQMRYTNIVEFGGIGSWPGELICGAE